MPFGWETGIPLLLAALSGIGALTRYAYKSGRAAERRDQAVLRSRLEHVYGPARALLVNVHITTASSIMYGHFSIRLRRARRHLRERGLHARVSDVARLLFERGETKPSIGVEYGTPFPLDELTELVSKNAPYVDAKLFLLIQRANRAQYENALPGGQSSVWDMNEEDLALADHIFEEYESLVSRIEKGN